MKCIKMVGLLIMAVVALGTFAASVSATILTSPTANVYTLPWTAESHSATELHGSFVTVKCNKSHVSGNIESHGPGKTVAGKLNTLSFTECNFPVSVLKAGSLEIHAVNCGVYCTGTLTSSGAEVTIQTSIANCIFNTSNTDIGIITPTNDTGGHATLDLESASIPRKGHSIFCGSSGEWTGAYTMTTPATLWIDA